MVSRPRVSDVVNQKTAKFTIDTLVDMLSRVGKPVRLDRLRAAFDFHPGEVEGDVALREDSTRVASQAVGLIGLVVLQALDLQEDADGALAAV